MIELVSSGSDFLDNLSGLFACIRMFRLFPIEGSCIFGSQGKSEHALLFDTCDKSQRQAGAIGDFEEHVGFGELGTRLRCKMILESFPAKQAYLVPNGSIRCEKYASREDCANWLNYIFV